MMSSKGSLIESLDVSGQRESPVLGSEEAVVMGIPF